MKQITNKEYEEMRMKINPNKVIEERLATSFGLEQYGYIISQWKSVDVSADEPFQTKFNGCHRVRRNSGGQERNGGNGNRNSAGVCKYPQIFFTKGTEKVQNNIIY